ncbi:hypothetical protein [Sphaerisporangium aureirubrum]|uniref:Uncharacterized protein n=1 Tax=Sphaerisporangium aureirubrum TaxID=1544736 RepID=A0ABW1NKL4_9ACTN
MYGWIWRIVPGGVLVKTLTMLALVMLAGVILWYLVFPILEPYVTVDRGTVGG